MKYTRGPWTLQTDGKGFYWIDKLTKDGGFSICNLGTDEEAKGNGKLIISAHTLKKENIKLKAINAKLLEACEKALWWTLNSEKARFSTQEDIKVILEQTIAKAKRK